MLGCILGCIWRKGDELALENIHLERYVMGKLTVLDIKSQKKPCRLPDGEGLFFEITKSKLKRWLYRYKIKGKQGVSGNFSE